MNKFETLFSIVALLSYIRGVSTGAGQEITNGFNLQCSYNAWSEVVTFRIVVPNNTWFSIVLGSANHFNSDMIQVKADGNRSQVYDLYSTQN